MNNNKNRINFLFRVVIEYLEKGLIIEENFLQVHFLSGQKESLFPSHESAAMPFAHQFDEYILLKRDIAALQTKEDQDSQAKDSDMDEETLYKKMGQ